MLINGLKVSAENGATFERRNPLDGSVAKRASAADALEAKTPQFIEAVATETGASAMWARRPR